MSAYALIGEKLGHSYSKIIHEKFYKEKNLRDTYELIEIPKGNLKEEFKRISSEYAGINVTIPYKQDVMEFLNELSPEAQDIGAVNTVRFLNGCAKGYNTDYFGLKCTLNVNDIDIKNKKVVILGTGGVSKAALAVCRDMGAGDITFVSTSQPDLRDYRVISYNDKIEGDVLINCTPVGMYPNVDACPVGDISSSFGAVVDTIYNPAVTRLMEMACGKGIKAVSGLYMLVSQALYSQAIWRGEDTDTEMIDKIYRDMSAN